MKRENLSDWDVDFTDGTHAENLLSEVIETSEVKFDRRWHETGNIYIECVCYKQASNKYEYSGIMISKAKYYSLVLPSVGEPVIVSVPTDLLKEVMQKHGQKTDCKDLRNPSKGYLVKVEDIINEHRRKT